ncbi:MAG: Soluble lytic murein transglycosylase precursor, partial [Labilithrix sp.]|nr:Soluble lytic murein transglycosylase precursor [Labilithrix sp.]
MKAHAAIFAALATALAGCPHRAAPAPASTTDGGSQASDGASAIDSGSPPALPGAWTELVRESRWKEADESLAALAEGEQKKPEVRFVRARVALALGRHAEAVTRVDKLEEELPLLRDAIAKVRAQGALVAGPFDRAAEWYAARSSPSAWLSAAEAWDKQNDPVRARAQCDRVINEPKRSRAAEEKARGLRMKLVRAKEGDAAALADARWLAINALDDATATQAGALLDRTTPRPAPLD